MNIKPGLLVVSVFAIASSAFADTCGYIDKTAKFVIKPVYSAARNFKEGLAPVQLGTMWGYIGKAGKMAIQPKFDDADEFSEGLAKIKLNDKYGYIDKTGAITIAPQFESAWKFSEGLAPAALPVNRLETSWILKYANWDGFN